MASSQKLEIDTHLDTTDLRRQIAVLLEAFEAMRDACTKLMAACRDCLDGLDAVEADRLRRRETSDGD